MDHFLRTRTFIAPRLEVMKVGDPRVTSKKMPASDTQDAGAETNVEKAVESSIADVAV